MRSIRALCLAAVLGLSACSGVSTGVRSPCFERGNAVVTRGLALVATAPSSSSRNQISPTASPEARDGCDFRSF